MHVDQLSLPQQGRIKYDATLSFIRFASDMGTVIDPTEWTIDKGVYRTAVNTLSRIFFTLTIPNSGTITEVNLILKGAAGHGSWPGLTAAPTASVYAIESDTGNKTLLGTDADPTSSPAAYQAIHPLPVTVSHVANTFTKRYVVEVTTENGTGAIAGADYYGCIVHVTPDTLPDYEA